MDCSNQTTRIAPLSRSKNKLTRIIAWLTQQEQNKSFMHLRISRLTWIGKGFTETPPSQRSMQYLMSFAIISNLWRTHRLWNMVIIAVQDPVTYVTNLIKDWASKLPFPGMTVCVAMFLDRLLGTTPTAEAADAPLYSDWGALSSDGMLPTLDEVTAPSADEQFKDAWPNLNVVHFCHHDIDAHGNSTVADNIWMYVFCLSVGMIVLVITLMWKFRHYIIARLMTTGRVRFPSQHQIYCEKCGTQDEEVLHVVVRNDVQADLWCIMCLTSFVDLQRMVEPGRAREFENECLAVLEIRKQGKLFNHMNSVWMWYVQYSTKRDRIRLQIIERLKSVPHIRFTRESSMRLLILPMIVGTVVGLIYQQVFGGLSSDTPSKGESNHGMYFYITTGCIWLGWVAYQGAEQPRAPGHFALEYATASASSYRPPLRPLINVQPSPDSFARQYALAAGEGQSWNTPSTPTPPSTPMQHLPLDPVINTNDLPGFGTNSKTATLPGARVFRVEAPGGSLFLGSWRPVG